MRPLELWLRWRRLYWQAEADRAERRLEWSRHRYYVCTQRLRLMRGNGVVFLDRRR